MFDSFFNRSLLSFVSYQLLPSNRLLLSFIFFKSHTDLSHLLMISWLEDYRKYSIHCKSFSDCKALFEKVRKIFPVSTIRKYFRKIDRQMDIYRWVQTLVLVFLDQYWLDNSHKDKASLVLKQNNWQKKKYIAHIKPFPARLEWQSIVNLTFRTSFLLFDRSSFFKINTMLILFLFIIMDSAESIGELINCLVLLCLLYLYRLLLKLPWAPRYLIKYLTKLA